MARNFDSPAPGHTCRSDQRTRSGGEEFRGHEDFPAAIEIKCPCNYPPEIASGHFRDFHPAGSLVKSQCLANISADTSVQGYHAASFSINAVVKRAAITLFGVVIC